MKSHRFIAFPFLLPFLFTPGPAQEVDPLVSSIVRAVSADSLFRTVERLAAFGTRHTLSDTVHATRGIGAARRWIAGEFSRHAASSEGRMLVRFHETTVPPSSRIPSPTRVVNVLATLHPVDRSSASASRVIIVSAHYDSRAFDPMDAVSDAPGANDDGSGTALLLELARIIAPHTFESTIILAAFAGEEQGLLGATALAEEARQMGWNIEAVLNNDIVGNSTGGDGVQDRTSVRVFSQALAPSDSGDALRRLNATGLLGDTPSRNLARYVEMVAERYVKDYDVRLIYRLDRYLRGGDHRPFHERGFAAVRISEARENFDHQHQNVRIEGGKDLGDLPKFVDAQYLAQVARVNSATLATLALAPPPPEDVTIEVRSLGYDTALKWRPGASPDLKGYRVLFRATSSSTWQEHVDVSDTTARLNVLKDDLLFGVQTVDLRGNTSLPALPLGGRR